MDCYACQDNGRFDQLPPRERIAADAHWRVAHDFNSTLPGRLILVPRRHVTSIAALTDAEAAVLGTWPVRLSRALEEVTGCVRTYVVQFAEKDGFAHVHFHAVPRMSDLPENRRGPNVLQYLKPHSPDDHLAEEQRDGLARAIQAALGNCKADHWLQRSPNRKLLSTRDPSVAARDASPRHTATGALTAAK